MNDAAFSNMFYASTYQHAELSTPIHTVEHDMTSSSNLYFNSSTTSFLDDEQNSFFPSFPLTQQQQQHQQTSSTIKQPSCNDTLTTNRTSLADIPFVQIHTTDVHQQLKSFGNVFRRSAAIIKSEVKAEAADNSKERTNATPTPPARNSSCQSIEASVDTALCGKKSVNIIEDTHINVDHNETHELPSIHKCNQCAFISLSVVNVENHIATVHLQNQQNCSGDNRHRIICPGCENIFYSYISLESHIREDHLMAADELTKVLSALKHYNAAYAASNSPRSQDNYDTQQETQTKSRIYIKNVERLLKPNHEANDQQQQQQHQQLNQMSDNFFTMNHFDDSSNFLCMLDDAIDESQKQQQSEDCVTNMEVQQKQKISIKSVDVLREPALLRRDQQNTDNTISIEAVEQVNYVSYCDNQEVNGGDLSSFDKSRRPKIYIKNVDILKEPMLLPSNLNCANVHDIQNYNYPAQNMLQGSANSLNSTTTTPEPEFENNLQTLNNITEQFLYDNSSSNNSNNINHININNTNNNNNNSNSSHNNNIYMTCNTFDPIDEFAFINTPNSNNFILDNTRFVGDLDCVMDYTNSHATISMITEPTPAVQPSTSHTEAMLPQSDIILPTDVQTAMQATEITVGQKQKIFIKNVDILKAPQFQQQDQQQRGTLHLRTVDELNLMNRNEVENLIAPNLDMNGAMMMSEQQFGVPTPTITTNGNDITNNAMKLQVDFDAQLVNSWQDDYDLGDDLDCIITDSIAPLMEMRKQHNNDNILDTPQLSIISICDIDEQVQQQQILHNHLENHNVQSLTESTDEVLNVDLPNLYAQNEQQQVQQQHNTAVSQLVETDLKSECTINKTKSIVSTPPPTSTASVITTATTAKVSLSVPLELPPLAPVTTTATSNGSYECNNAPIAAISNLPVPPLVPVLPLRPSNTTKKNSSKALSSPTEKGRIYVANNLLSLSSQPITLSGDIVGGGTSVRGRPYGGKRTIVTKMRKLSGSTAADIEANVGIKCNIHGCAFRFKKPDTLDYHKRCHNNSDNQNSPQSLHCPECKSTEFNNWNTLHTHLWRSHQIDMELYSCELCTFKTPIYSRLINTHAKIHSDERNFKCDQCEKAFKNTKQLKNHRRWHRYHIASKANANIDQSAAKHLFRCDDCGAAFSHAQSLREHLCKNRSDQVQCQICQRVVSSKSSLKLHMLTHEVTKRFKCEDCGYESNDHNAFRRHKMRHDEKRKMYCCPHCDYKSIQSVVYQKHVQQKHPDKAANIVHKCSICSFATINRSLLLVHQAKHETPTKRNVVVDSVLNTNYALINSSNTNMAEEQTTHVDDNALKTENLPTTKIKVKSNYLLTDPVKYVKSIDELNISSNVLLAPNFEYQVT